ncbi:mucin-2-like [Cheilinus undulatus]|uniref:mucin-2-like n=1 Tax=Cheilinus undulatus TaxID=241271 RepID=UPI001BD4D069|nr:mucin-2-like [Cheilinus undulatus]
MCVRMWSEGFWEDSQCFMRSPFICYDGTSGSNQHFIFVGQMLSWSEAQGYCRKHYTDLASVRDEEENQEIQQLADNRSVWIGLYRTLEWSDKSDSTYRYWKHGQPDNFGGKQNCTAADLGNTGLWSDEECSRKLAFICYGEKKETPDKPVLSTASTVIPNKLTTTEKDSTTTKITSTSVGPPIPKQGPASSTPAGGTSNKPHSSTTSISDHIVVTPDKNIKSTTGNFNTEMTSFGKPSTTEVYQTEAITTGGDQNQPISFTYTSSTIVTANKKTTNDFQATNDPVSAEITSSELPSITKGYLKIPTTNETPDKPVYTMTTASTMTPDPTTTLTTKSTTGFISKETTQFTRTSTRHVDHSSAITSETPNQPFSLTTTTGVHQTRPVTMSPEIMTTTGTDSTIGYVPKETTQSRQRSTTHVDQTSAISGGTSSRPFPSTTSSTATQNKRTTMETKSITSPVTTEIPLLRHTSTIKRDQTTTRDRISNHPPFTSSTTVTPNQRTTNNFQATTDHISTEIKSSEQPSTTEVQLKRPTANETPERPLYTMINTSTVTPDPTTTMTSKSTTGYASKETTQFDQPSTTHVDQTRAITSGMPNLPFSPTSTTTGTQNRRITTETLSTTGLVTTEIPSLRHSSTTNVDLIPTTNGIPNKLPSSTYTSPTTITPDQRTTNDFRVTTGQVSMEVTSSEHSSTTYIPFKRPSTNETPDKPVNRVTTTSTMTPDPTTTLTTKPATVYASKETTQFNQTSTTHVDKARAMTRASMNQPFSSPATTTETQYKRTTAPKSLSASGIATTEIPSLSQPSTTMVDQTTETDGNQLSLSTYTTTTTIVTPKRRTTNDIDAITGLPEMASSKPPSTTGAQQTRPVTMSPVVTTTEATSTTRLVNEENIRNRQPSTTHVDQTRTITSGTPRLPFTSTSTTTGSQNRGTTTETKSTGLVITEISTLRYTSSKIGGQTTSTTGGITSHSPLSTYTATTTVTQNQRTAGQFSTDSKSSKPPSTTGVHLRRPTTNETPDKKVYIMITTSTVTPDPTTTLTTISTTGYASKETTQFDQPSTTHVDQESTITSKVCIQLKRHSHNGPT